MLHEKYHKSTVGEDGEIPLDALGSPPQTEMGSFLYSGPSTDMADTVSLPRQQKYTSTREHGIQTCRQLQGLLKTVWILFTQSPPMGLWIARPNFWPNFYPDLKTRM